MTKEEFLVSKGWEHKFDAWVHPKVVKNKPQDVYILYFLKLDKAYEFETKEVEPFDDIIKFCNWAYGFKGLDE
jgi:hypothetical protein